ncbi:FAD-binding protein [Fulvivirgaceae bacterium BMA10]|uniref:FAD-binding protein n=1 Tax=Splendidivirga corallicola TaxID=3051826 RepID=A0ABT8KP02_9BACT|nr:FAD-binding protein [Fulvivirgaceae bacterium BMA10]
MSNQHRKNKKSFFGRPIWQNSTKTIKVAPQRYYQPESLQDVLEMVQEGIDTKTPVRAVGSGHSFSDAPKAEGILIDTDKLNRLSGIYNFTNKQGHYFEVEGGIKVHELNAALDKAGYCIPTMGGIDHQSIAGAISTGTHGSSLLFGAMSNMVKSIILVTHDLQDKSKAKTYRIERAGSNALTNDPDYQGPELIQDDDIFNSAVVCFGVMGIIFSYVLEVDKMYYLSEKKEVSEWKSVLPKLRDGSIFDNHRSVFVQVNPYKFKGKNLTLVVYHDDYATCDRNMFLERLKHGFWHRLKRFSRSFSFELVSRFPYLLWFAIWRINTFPNYVPRFLNTAVKSQRDEEYFNKGYKVMYQGLDYVKERAFDCEIAVPMDPEGNYLDTVEALMEYLGNLREEYKMHITSPLGLRFIKGSEVFLTPEHGEDVCYIDTPALLHVYGRDTIISRIQQFLLSRGAKPHWGKLNQYMDVDYVKTRYPRFDDFMRVIEKFNATGIFYNIFTKRILGR